MKRIFAFLMAAALLACASCAGAENLRVDFYDVGKADAMLITTPGGERILIDAATNKEGKKLAQRLLQEGVSFIDVLIITHYDKDHVGGADQILENLSVGTVYMPVYDKDSKQYEQFVQALAKHPPLEIRQLRTREETVYTTRDGIQLHVSTAHESFYGSDEENDFSLAVRMTYGDTRFLFAGDAENARQQELLLEGNVACDVLKVPYHGRYEKSSPAFLASCAPKIAFIPDAMDDPADELVLRLLEDAGAQVFCAKDGDVAVYSDGKNVWAE